MEPLTIFYAICELLLLYVVAWTFGEIGSRSLPAIQKFNEKRKRIGSSSEDNAISYQQENNDPNNPTKNKSYIKLPPLLGMLIGGLLVRNIKNNYLLQHIPDMWSAELRKAALTVILIRAGMGLNVNALKSKSWTTLRLAFMPCLAEVITIAIFAHFVFQPYNINFVLSVAMGFVLGAVSPAVVVPGLLDLQDQGFGVNKGVPSMVLAAASLDDISAITGFGISVSLAFNEGGDLFKQIIHGPTEVIGALVIGSFLGWLLGTILNLHEDDEKFTRVKKRKKKDTEMTLISKKISKHSVSTNYHSVVHSHTRLHSISEAPSAVGSEHMKQIEKVERNRTMIQFIVLGVTAFAVVFIASEYEYSGGGYLATMIIACICSRKWNKAGMTKIAFKKLWYFMQVALFMLIGAEIDLTVIKADDIGIIIAILCFSLIVRLLVTFLAASGKEAQLNLKEKLFVAVAWFPKATVQAAVGSTVLDTAKSLDDYKDDDYYLNIGEFILIAAVLSILITAPIGAIGIYVAGPKWLTRGVRLSTLHNEKLDAQEEEDDPESNLL